MRIFDTPVQLDLPLFAGKSSACSPSSAAGGTAASVGTVQSATPNPQTRRSDELDELVANRVPVRTQSGKSRTIHQRPDILRTAAADRAMITDGAVVRRS